jgi:hypothetical protein
MGERHQVTRIVRRRAELKGAANLEHSRLSFNRRTNEARLA